MKRKIYDQLLLWKNKRKGKSAMMIEGLNSILGGDKYFYRQSATRLYYDPSGPAYNYVYGDEATGTNKLFVIYIGETSLAINPYFFDPARGYVNP